MCMFGILINALLSTHNNVTVTAFKVQMSYFSHLLQSITHTHSHTNLHTSECYSICFYSSNTTKINISYFNNLFWQTVTVNIHKSWSRSPLYSFLNHAAHASNRWMILNIMKYLVCLSKSHGLNQDFLFFLCVWKGGGGKPENLLISLHLNC